MYESALVFISKLKQKSLYIVSCVQCDIWDITAYFLLPELKYHYEKIYILYFWLLEITTVRIRFLNYLFKADKILSHHLGHNRIFAADGMRILLQKKHRFLPHI